MQDDLETVVQGMTDGEALTNPEVETIEPTPNVDAIDDGAESADQERNPDGTFKSSASDDESDDEAKEASAENGESDDTDSEEEAPERKERSRNARTRIGELTAQRNEARVRAEMAERRLQELQQGYQEPDPNLEFDDPAKFTQQAVRQALDERTAQETLSQQQQARVMEVQASQEMFMARVDDVRDELPDFDEVFNENVPITETAVEFLAESEAGPRIAHHLGKNLSLARRIAAMPPVKQAVELTRLENKLSAPLAKRQTKAPKPAGRISGAGSSGTFDPDSASVDDIAKQLGYGK